MQNERKQVSRFCWTVFVAARLLQSVNNAMQQTCKQGQKCDKSGEGTLLHKLKGKKDQRALD